MTTVLLHSGAAAPKLETPRPQVKVVRGGNRGLNRARRFAQATLLSLIHISRPAPPPKRERSGVRPTASA